jgi:hypothetical protein
MTKAMQASPTCVALRPPVAQPRMIALVHMMNLAS